jgi:hypothetical protein
MLVSPGTMLLILEYHAVDTGVSCCRYWSTMLLVLEFQQYETNVSTV